eukprot:1144812-Pelagomonas_calceolata.AAC.9
MHARKHTYTLLLGATSSTLPRRTAEARLQSCEPPSLGQRSGLRPGRDHASCHLQIKVAVIIQEAEKFCKSFLHNSEKVGHKIRSNLNSGAATLRLAPFQSRYLRAAQLSMLLTDNTMLLQCTHALHFTMRTCLESARKPCMS